MDKAASLPLLFQAHSGKNRISAAKRAQHKVSVPSLVWFLVAANGLLLLNYIYDVNKYASKGYEIKKLQVQLSALTEENRKISVKTAEATSMVSIQNDFLKSSFVAAGTSQFLQAGQFTQR